MDAAICPKASDHHRVQEGLRIGQAGPVATTAAGLALERMTPINADKVMHWFETDLVTASGEVIARVRKQVYVRLKPKAR